MNSSASFDSKPFFKKSLKKTKKNKTKSGKITVFWVKIENLSRGSPPEDTFSFAGGTKK
jgi:hypothetical protein